jgi:hypothetical protein
MPKDWEINTSSGDLTVSGGDFVFVTEELQVAQAVETTLRSFIGEWFLDTSFGVPYFQSILGQRMVTKSVFDSFIKAAVVGVANVNRILAYESDFNRTAREFSVTLTADTTFGPVTVEGVLP